mgnify:CR=1 FL=1
MPEGWSREQKEDVLELQSKDGAARVAISAPGPAADANTRASLTNHGTLDVNAGTGGVRTLSGALTNYGTVDVGRSPKDFDIGMPANDARRAARRVEENDVELSPERRLAPVAHDDAFASAKQRTQARERDVVRDDARASPRSCSTPNSYL